MIGRVLRKERELTGLSLRSVAKSIGVTPGHLSLVERDQQNPRFDTIVRMCRVINLPVETVAAEVKSSERN